MPTDDSEIQQRFLEATLPASLTEDLRAYLAEARYPAGGALVELAGGFAVPAVHGSVRDVHARAISTRMRVTG